MNIALEMECERLEAVYRILRPRKDRIAKRAYRRLVWARAAALTAECDAKAAERERKQDLGVAA